MKKIIYFFIVAAMAITVLPPAHAQAISSGDLIKASTASVYYYGANGKRYVFPNEKTYFTWYDDFSTVKTITDEELAAIPIGGNATYKPGIKMVKITTDPKVYAVSPGGVLRWITTESIAIVLYGDDWNTKVEDVPDAFFTNYALGDNITSEADYDPNGVRAGTASINVNKGLSAGEPKEEQKQLTYRWNIRTINKDAYMHNNLAVNKFNGGFVAAWNDDRHGQQEVQYQLISASGEASGDVVRISGNLTTSNNAKPVFSGNNLFFIWEDSSLLRRALYLQKRDKYANLLSEVLFTSSTSGTSENPDIVWSASLNEYGVVWWDSRSTTESNKGDVHFSRLTDGGLKVGDLTVVSEMSLLEVAPQIVTAGENFGVLWQDIDHNIKFALIDRNSKRVGDVKVINNSLEADAPRMVWTGEYFGVTWEDKNGEKRGVNFLLLDSAGNKVGSSRILVDGETPDILWTGQNFYIAYVDSMDVYTMKVSVNGNITESGKNVSATYRNCYTPRLGKNGELIEVFWLEDESGANKIMGAIEIAS